MGGHAKIPDFTHDEVAALLRTHYSRALGDAAADITCAALCSYIDQNVRVNTGGGAPQWVFKAANAAETEDQVKAECAVMGALVAGGLGGRVPRTVAADSGAEYIRVPSPRADGASHLIRLVTFVQGEALAKVEHTPALARDFGAVVGTIDAVLAPLKIRATERYLRWDLQNAAQIEPLFGFVIQDPQKQALVRHFMQKFTTCASAMTRLPRSLIYNDANDYNVLTDGTAITGVVDFGDIVTAPVVCEVAIALAYLLMAKDEAALLRTAMSFLAGYSERRPLSAEEVDVLWWLIGARLCVSVTFSAHEVTQQPENREYVEVSAKPAWALLELMQKMDAAHITKCFRAACGIGAHVDPAVAELVAAAHVRTANGNGNGVSGPHSHVYTNEEISRFRKAHCPRTMSSAYKQPLKITEGKGPYLYTEDGQRYLDCVNNVCHVGHCHPRVVRAGQRQMEILNTNTRYLSDNLVVYIKELLATLPPSLDCCFLLNSGTEANELAYRLAMAHTKSKHMIVVDHAYHGHTHALIELSPYKFRDQGKRPVPADLSIVDMPDPYRGTYQRTGVPEEDATLGPRYAQQVADECERLKARGIQPAAFWAESLMGVGGQVIPPDTWLAECHRHARAHGALCICDEVQVGFGRVGTHMWAFQCQGGDVVPDIVSFGKPVANGHPMAVVVCRKDIAESFANSGMEYFATFGGNPVSCAIGTEVLRVIKDEKLMENADTVGEYFRGRLREMQTQHSVIGDVRGKGMFIGAEMVADPKTKQPWVKAPLLAEGMKARGVLITTDGPDNNVLKIKPPIVWDKSCVDKFITALHETLLEMGA